jgi:WD40 repeat protein
MIATNGVFTWTPGCAQGSTSNLIKILVTDTGRPPLSNSTTFVVTVGECVQVGLGTTVLQLGQSACVPVNLLSTVALTNLSFSVAFPTNRFSNWAFSVTNFPVESSSVQVVSSSRAVFSPDGKQVLTVSVGKTARLWDAATGKSLALLIGHDDEVESAVFSADGKQVLTGSLDKTARLWDAATGRSIAVLTGHDGEVHTAVFSPDGKQVLTASEDKTARLWAVLQQEGQTLINHAKSIVPRQLTSDQRKQFFLDPN